MITKICMVEITKVIKKQFLLICKFNISVLCFLRHMICFSKISKKHVDLRGLMFYACLDDFFDPSCGNLIYELVNIVCLF